MKKLKQEEKLSMNWRGYLEIFLHRCEGVDAYFEKGMADINVQHPV